MTRIAMVILAAIAISYQAESALGQDRKDAGDNSLKSGDDFEEKYKKALDCIAKAGCTGNILSACVLGYQKQFPSGGGLKDLQTKVQEVQDSLQCKEATAYQKALSCFPLASSPPVCALDIFSTCLENYTNAFPFGDHIEELQTKVHDMRYSAQCKEVAAYQKALTCFPRASSPPVCAVDSFSACLEVYKEASPLGDHLEELQAKVQEVRGSPECKESYEYQKAIACISQQECAVNNLNSCVKDYQTHFTFGIHLKALQEKVQQILGSSTCKQTDGPSECAGINLSAYSLDIWPRNSFDYAGQTKSTRTPCGLLTCTSRGRGTPRACTLR
jgi:hypothetical protein